MDLGPVWPFQVATVGALAGVVVLCWAAWRTPAAGSALVGGRGVLLWWALALAPWLLRERILHVVAQLGLALPGSDWEYVPPSEGGVLLVAFLAGHALLTGWLLGAPLAALVATGRWAWRRRRGSRAPRPDGV